MRFTWGTDCFGLKFILTYDGTNPALLQLQMRFMCWDMDIVHRNDRYLVDADYWSHLSADLCFDPLLCDYIQRATSIRLNNPVPERMPVLAENMPGAREPHLQEPADTGNLATVNAIDTHAQSLISYLY